MIVVGDVLALTGANQQGTADDQASQKGTQGDVGQARCSNGGSAHAGDEDRQADTHYATFFDFEGSGIKTCRCQPDIATKTVEQVTARATRQHKLNDTAQYYCH